ncbi:hypothetical protein B0J15DRAFT_154934 [Fusarium solani]|uniref:Uncharacterized protein n=1 Tax=Fusarium solani TaxID=169388 RepID=A0A9P9G762_FUSSL|nr:uncharacterized protein B0J15DRAFT_154934 [Fusarium solani]KAH7234063.1 hypothetical protein B0J15DRAFT_154934 [Fusarium solani]
MDGNYYGTHLFTFLLHLSTHDAHAHAHAQAPSTHTDWPPPLTEGTHLGTVPRRCCHFPSLARKTRRNTINTKILIFLPPQLFSFPLALFLLHTVLLFYIHHRILLVCHHSTITAAFFTAFTLFDRLSLYSFSLCPQRACTSSPPTSSLLTPVSATESDPAEETTLIPVQVLTPGRSFDRLEKNKPSLVLRETPTADLA